MNAKKRYSLLLFSVFFLAVCYYGGHKLRDRKGVKWKDSLPKLNGLDLPDFSEFDLDVFHDFGLSNENKSTSKKFCTMETCFNLDRCRGRPFRVYVYPQDDHLVPSESYSKILNTLRDSRYFTSNPDEACLFVLSLDTLDRDPLSTYDFVHNMPGRFAKLDYWNNGENHVIFNLYSGTYPNYTEDLYFDVGKAILAKASISEEQYRPGFDVSIPLFHKNHPERGGEPGSVMTNNFPVVGKHFLAFKGKRYLYGIGSETRNSLYHLHNGKSLVLVTTCRHGKNWKNLKDDRCDADNEEFDKWDYNDLLTNSTFCLVPRGRRLGSFRFIETLQAGCVPVLLSNGWRLPFAEVIDWTQATIQADERLLLQVPDLLHSVPASKVFAMRQQTQILWERYLSSVEKIVDTTLEIIHERIKSHLGREGLIWNSNPGALFSRLDATRDTPFEFSECSDITQLPGCDEMFSFSSSIRDQQSAMQVGGRAIAGKKFSAVISSRLGSAHPGATLFKLVRNVSASPFVDKILVYWPSSLQPPPVTQWHLSKTGATPVIVIPSNSTSPSVRFRPDPAITTSAILSLDDSSVLTTDEINFAFSVWRHFPERIVGFSSRSHFWDDNQNRWAYTSKWLNEYSMVLTGAAFLHRYYFHLYTEYLSHHFLRTVSQVQNCEDILMNLLVSHVSRRPPIKVTQRKSLTLPKFGSKTENFSQRQSCFNSFIAGFGYNPLKKSSVRFDPVLYKDPVSSIRKKYRKLENVPITDGL